MSDQPVLDPTALDGLRALNPGDDGAFLRELIVVFLQEAPAYRASLHEAFSSRDASAALTAAHTLKGSASNFGAAKLASISLRIEKLAKAGSLEEARPLLPELDHEFSAVQQALKKVLTGLA